MLSHILLALAAAALALASPAHAAQLYHREGKLDLAATRPTAPNTWQATAVADPTAEHSVTIALHFRNRDYFEQLFHEVHDPTHKSWLSHLSREQIHAIIAPPKETTDRLLAWMTQERGVPAEHVELLIGANAIRVQSTVAHINALFNTTLHVFTHTDGRKTVRQLGASYMADEFASLVHIVDGLAMMPYQLKRHGFVVELDKYAARTAAASQHRHSAASVVGNVSVPAPLQQSSVLDWIPANSLYAQYNVPDMSGQSYSTTPATSTQTTQFYTSDSSGNLQANSFSPSDLQQYSQLWSQSASSRALHVWTIRGNNNANKPTDEPTLDVQSITSMNPVAANQFELVASGQQQYYWASSFVSRTNIAQVVSISYGIDESVFETPAYASQTQDGQMLSNYLAATNNLFMSIGMRGTTILASSGDDGAQGTGGRSEINSNGQCIYSNNPYDSTTPRGPTVEFPASSPYVTAVGATEIVASSSAYPQQLSGSTSYMCSGLTNSQLRGLGITPPSSYSSYRCLNPSQESGEQAVSIANSGFTSGGGFSRFYNRATQASWQNTVVGNYLSGNNRVPSSQYFNRTGRAVPDVSIYGGYFPLVLNGAISLAAGTSLSSPLFAAIIALLNQQTLNAKGATIGWANPLLYSMAAGSSGTFKDITTGANNCPAGDQACDTTTCQGYQAASGWDPVTGLGVPNYGNMQQALSQYLSQVTGTNTGSVTGISAAAGGASASLWLSVAVVLATSVMAAMAL